MRQIFNDYVDIINPDISVDGAPESKCTVVTSNICVLECASTAVWEHMATYACALEVQNHIFQHFQQADEPRDQTVAAGA